MAGRTWADERDELADRYDTSAEQLSGQGFVERWLARRVRLMATNVRQMTASPGYDELRELRETIARYEQPDETR